MVRFYLSLCLLTLLCSCAKPKDEQITSAKQLAKYYLTKEQCSKAKSALDEVNYQDGDGEYISLYASAYACKAGYRELDFFENLGDISGTNLLNSLASFSSSNPAIFKQSDLDNLMSGIQTIVESTNKAGTNKREKKFGLAKGTDLNLQLLYMTLYTLGKFFAYYGNADEDGFKGQGSNTNVCIGRYDFHVDVHTTLSSNPVFGCNSGNDGHPDLAAPATETVIKKKMCQGIVMFNTLLDILTNVTLSDDDSMGDLGDMSDDLDALLDQAAQAEAALPWGGTAVTTLKQVLSFKECQSHSLADIQRFYIFLFELTFSDT